MDTDRLKALTDGVIAVIITIMVLELKPPSGTTIAELARLAPIFFSYALSFVYVAIYWNNHHHFLSLTPRVTGGIMWANFHLLFWLSLIPFATAWIDDHLGRALPTAIYGAVLLLTAIAWIILQQTIIRAGGAGSRLRQALGRDRKGKLSLLCYVVGIALSAAAPVVATVLYAAVAVLWFVPDRRVHRELHRAPTE